MNKIILLCMGKKGYQTISDIIEILSTEVVHFVVAARDPQTEEDYYDEIVNLTKKHNISFYDKEDNWDKNIRDEYVIAISWRWLINEAKEKRLIIAHDSLLPQYRGFAPLVNMLINKETTIGVTFLFASAKYDAGDIILQKNVPITYPITIAQAIDLVALKYSEGLIEIIKTIQNGKKIQAIPQDNKKATYSLWRDAEDYIINFNDSAENIKRFIDAVGFPYKGATAYIKNEKVRILDAIVYDDKTIENRNMHIGKVIFLDKKDPVIICKNGLLKLQRVINDKKGESILPLKNFRTRFKGKI